MQTYKLTLKSDVFKTFRCQKAANALDIDVEAKSIHDFSVTADLTSPFNVGLIVGASGSGKTTFAKHVFGDDCFKTLLIGDKPVIDQLPEDWDYETCAKVLGGVGLTSVPCWIRPAHTLSNGQRARAEIALQIAYAGDEIVAIDEWTSVVDRTVAKVMSHCINKFARRQDKRIVLCSCHYDVIEWLDPDWVIDCNKQVFIDRRRLRRGERIRQETLTFDIREVGRETWPYFSKYHYLNKNLPGGHVYFFGLFVGDDQIGFQCFANYVPHRNKGQRMKMHSNRVVIHPDYAGFGLSIKLINECAKIMYDKGFDVWAKSTSLPIYILRRREKCWKLMEKKTVIKQPISGQLMVRKTGFREKVTYYSFKYVRSKADQDRCQTVGV